VKTGSGAFMKSEKDAAFLAELMVETGERMGKHVVALITDMDQPLGNMIGNALEVIEVVEVLRGGGPEDLRELCLELADGCCIWAERRRRWRRESAEFEIDFIWQSAGEIPADGGTAGWRFAGHRRCQAVAPGAAYDAGDKC